MMARNAKIISHQEQVAAIASAILYPIRQQRFHMKALAIKQRTRALVVGDHLGSHFSKLQRPRQCHYLRAETLAETPRAPFRGGIDTNLADPAGPSQRI